MTLYMDYNEQKRINVNIDFDFNKMQYVITRRTPSDVWTERTTDGSKARRIAENFKNLSTEQLESRIRAGRSLAK